MKGSTDTENITKVWQYNTSKTRISLWPWCNEDSRDHWQSPLTKQSMEQTQSIKCPVTKRNWHDKSCAVLPVVPSTLVPQCRQAFLSLKQHFAPYCLPSVIKVAYLLSCSCFHIKKQIDLLFMGPCSLLICVHVLALALAGWEVSGFWALMTPRYTSLLHWLWLWVEHWLGFSLSGARELQPWETVLHCTGLLFGHE